MNIGADHLCPWWLAYFFDNRLRRLFYLPEEALVPYVREGMTVLDLGCGMGYTAIPLAKMVGASGRVICVDIQEKMLEILCQRAGRAGVLERIETRLAGASEIGVKEKADLATAIWMLHEVKDKESFLSQVKACLRPGSRFILVEPRLHVGSGGFREIVSLIEGLGFKMVERPKFGLSRAAVFALE